jgi:hypothetical protein
VVVLVVCLFAVLAIGIVAIYTRLPPRQAVEEERTARQEVQAGAELGVNEVEALIKEFRALLKELAETVDRERTISNQRQARFDKHRSTTEMFRVQLDVVSRTLNALLESVHLERGIADERQDRLDKTLAVSERLRLQLDAASCALELILVEVDAELSTVIDVLLREYTPERAKMLLARINNSRAKRAKALRETMPGAEHIERDLEETRPEGISAERIVRTAPSPAHPQEAPAQNEEPAALVDAEQSDPTRATAFPSTPEELDEPGKRAAATADDDDDCEMTQSISKAALNAAFGAGAGGATPTPQGVPRAVHSGTVAPPASAPPPLPSGPGIIAAGLGQKPTSSTYGVEPPAQDLPTATLLGMSPTLPQAPPKGTELAFAKTMASMPAHLASRPDSNDGDLTEVNETEALAQALHEHEQEQEAKRGFDGVHEAAPERQHGSEEKTPRKQRMNELEAGE